MLVILIALSTVFFGCANEQNSGDEQVYTSLSDFAGKRIGVNTGTIQGPMVEKQIPDAQLLYFNNDVDSLNALRQGKIDAFANAELMFRWMMIENEDLAILDDPLSDPVYTGAMFTQNEKGNRLLAQFNEFIKQIKSDGTYEELDGIWYGRDDSLKTITDPSSLPAVNGTLKLAVDTSLVPVAYIRNNAYAGLDIDIAVRFCEAYGYGLEIVDMSFSALVEAVMTEKCDFGIGGIAITAERAESVNFSDPIYESRSVLAYIKPSAKSSGSIFSSIRESFEKTFIRENRWKLFVQGIGTTMLITVLSILFGTAAGFAAFMLCRNGNKAANTIARFTVWLVQGMPVVVLLMILYYIIFGRTQLSGAAVSVIAFTLVFGCSVFGMLKMGVETVDRGQVEAAYSLGYTDIKAFMRFVLPQAVMHVLPSYKGEIKALIKATAVVGYVAVQDLTKMGDIVRSRTYEAFFPLIAVAIIYFILAAILTAIVERIGIRTDPMQRTEKDILKGIDTDIKLLSALP